jgi:hypothetical protein
MTTMNTNDEALPAEVTSLDAIPEAERWRYRHQPDGRLTYAFDTYADRLRDGVREGRLSPDILEMLPAPSPESAPAAPVAAPLAEVRAAEASLPIQTDGVMPLRAISLGVLPREWWPHYSRHPEGGVVLSTIPAGDAVNQLHYVAQMAAGTLRIAPSAAQVKAAAEGVAAQAAFQEALATGAAREAAEADARAERRIAEAIAKLQAQRPKNVQRSRAAELVDIEQQIAAGRLTR